MNKTKKTIPGMFLIAGILIAGMDAEKLSMVLLSASFGSAMMITGALLLPRAK